MRFAALLILSATVVAQTSTHVDYPTQIRNGPFFSDAGPVGSTLQTLCSNAGSGTLAITKRWVALVTQTVSCNLQGAGGIIQPASGQIVTFSGSFTCPLIQCIDLSLGGSVNLTGSVAAFYPEWTGSTCASTDNTVPMQAFFNILPPQSKAVFSCGYKVEAGVLYTPASMYGSLLQGSPANSGYESNVPVIKGLIAISGFSGTVLNVLTPGIQMRDFTVNSSGNATTGIVFQNAASGRVNTTAVYNSTGDQFQVNAYSGPTTTLTSGISQGVSSGTFTVANAALAGNTLGSTTCPNMVVAYGGSSVDYLQGTSSGNTITFNAVFSPGGITNHAHTSGAVIQCEGSNNDLQLTSIQGITSGGWGLNILEGSNNNSIVIKDPFFYSNTLGGAVLSGSVGTHTGGHYESNGGPAIQLGDIDGGDRIVGRATATWEIGQLADDEGNGFNGVNAVCDFTSTVRFATVANIEAAAAGGAGPFCPFAPAGVSTMGYGLSQQVGSGSPQMTVWSAFGTCTIQPAAGFTCANPSATQIATPFLASHLSIMSSWTTLQPPNYLPGQEATGSANNALVLSITDSYTGLPVSLVNGLPISLQAVHTLQAGANTLTLLQGNVTTVGAAVTFHDGLHFNTNWIGGLFIHGTCYTIQTVNSSTSITLTGSAGTQSSPVPYGPCLNISKATSPLSSLGIATTQYADLDFRYNGAVNGFTLQGQ